MHDPLWNWKGWNGLHVYANHGRWIAECGCRSASVVQPEQKAWRCSECGGGWVLLWPGRRAEIERLLHPRPLQNQSWMPLESVEDLAAENLEHGIVV